MIQKLPSPVHGQAIAPTSSHDRRETHRVRTVYRVARIQVDENEGLARVRNISNGGMRLSLTMPVQVGQTLEVSLSDTLSFKGCVAWAQDGECGVKFMEWIDSAEVLRRSIEEQRSNKGRAPRLTATFSALISSEKGVQTMQVHDISQRGMKIEHDGSFKEGLAVKVMMAPGVERRGYVRWVQDKFAGLLLTDPFSVEDLGSVSHYR